MKKQVRICRLLLIGMFLLGKGVLDIKAQSPSGTSLLQSGIDAMTPYGVPPSTVEIVSVDGQAFDKAFRVNTLNKTTANSDMGLDARLSVPLRKGDVLWVSFKARCLESKRETGEAFVELRFDQLIDGKYAWPSHLERGISIGKEWTETSIPFVMTKDVQPQDVRLVIKFDSYPQQFELGPVTFMNYGSTAKLDELPRSRVRYEGGEPDAPWRKAAASRIEQYRKGNLSIRVVDAKGKPIPGAKVEVRMKRNAYNWGTATSSQRLLDSSGAESKIYRDTLLKYFNQIVFENEMKWKFWYRLSDEAKGVQTKQAVRWLKDHAMGIRGHVMVWPSWKHSPAFLTDYKNDTAILRSLILKNIKEQATVMRGQFSEWDVVNEPFAHDDFLKLLGRKEMVTWFKAARAQAPGVKLFLNDYTMFHGEGAKSASEVFYDNIKFLKDNGAPIDAIGEQGHIGGTPPGIPKVLERLDRFAELNLPIQISEFDINSNDDDFKARYLGDFMTAVFSHPSTVGFVQWGFWEGQHWFPVAALWNKDWTMRKHGKVYTDLVSKEWWTNYDAGTSADGICKLRGFCGDYTISVKYKGKTVTQNYTLDNKGGNMLVKMTGN